MGVTEEPTFKSETRSIGEHEYKVVLFPAGRGFELLVDLKTILGESVGLLFSGQIEKAIAVLGGGMSKPEILSLVMRMLEFTFVTGHTGGFDKPFFDAHFVGAYGRLFKVLAFVVEVNYKDFFVEMRSGLNNALGNMDALLTKMEEAGLVDKEVAVEKMKDALK